MPRSGQYYSLDGGIGPLLEKFEGIQHELSANLDGTSNRGFNLDVFPNNLHVFCESRT